MLAWTTSTTKIESDTLYIKLISKILHRFVVVHEDVNWNGPGQVSDWHNFWKWLNRLVRSSAWPVYSYGRDYYTQKSVALCDVS